MRLIDADALAERFETLDTQALDYVGKLIERDGDEFSTEWKIWTAILNERTAFKHDVYDAPTIDAVPVIRCKDCKHRYIENMVWTCPFGLPGGPEFFCGYGAKMEVEHEAD